MLEHNPGLVGTPTQAADFLQEWFEADAAGGSIRSVDALADAPTPALEEAARLLRAWAVGWG